MRGRPEVANAAAPRLASAAGSFFDGSFLRLGHSRFQCGPSQYLQRACRSFHDEVFGFACRGGSSLSARSRVPRSPFLPLSCAAARNARPPLSSSTCLRNSRASWSPNTSRIARS
eukprot:2745531-Pleurochrysis_carterae.AAC.1